MLALLVSLDLIKSQSVSYSYFREQRRRAFQNVLRRATRSIVWAEGKGEFGVYHVSTLIQPYHGDGKKDKEHVDGCVDAALSPAYQP